MPLAIIAISILIMIYALGRYKTCISLIDEAHYSNNWKYLTTMIWFFIAGYAAYGYTLVAGYRFIDERLLTVLVFFLGSIYVFLITTLNRNIFQEIADLQREARHYTEHLEEEVRLRTLKLEELSVTDNLTGLFNQRYFYKKLEEEIYRTNRQGQSLFLLLFDIDKFKKYNDTHGHLAGDSVLNAVGKTILKNIRARVDSGCRYGGDEFTIILPNTTKDQATLVSHRIIHDLNEHHISISMGLVQCRGCDSKDPREFLKLADMAMYAAKAEGGNRIKIFQSKAQKAQCPDDAASKWSCI